jgi:hypothetical protein
MDELPHLMVNEVEEVARLLHTLNNADLMFEGLNLNIGVADLNGEPLGSVYRVGQVWVFRPGS